MTAYFVAYGILFLCLGIGLFVRRLRLGLLIGALPFVFLIAARGLVGTDTAQYLGIIRLIRAKGLFSVSLEPVFGILTNALMSFLHDPFATLIVVSVIVAVLMITAGLMLEKVPLIFSALVMPYFMFDMTMNGVRYGLAFALVALATVFLLRGRRWVFLALGALAGLTQISAIILVAGVWTLLEARLRTFVIVLITLVIFVFVFGSYLDDKASAYAGVYIVSALSGLVPFVLAAALLGGLFSVKEVRDSSLPQLAVLAAAVVVAFIMTRFSSGGLRVQQLILFLIYLYGAARIYRLQVEIWRNEILIVVAMAMAIAAGGFRLKNFSDDKYFGATPFNPYYFVWNHYGSS